MKKNLRPCILFVKLAKDYSRYILPSIIISKGPIVIVITLMEALDAIFILKMLKIFPRHLLTVNSSPPNQ